MPNVPIRSRLLRHSLILALINIPFFAVAADAPASDPSKLEEIVVTAQKRTESLESVPISAQVFSGQSLIEQNYNSLQDLSQTTPDVHIGNSSVAAVDMYVRGIGSGVGGGNAAFDQSVAVFNDDIFHGRSRMSDATFVDIDRIEVLKGPQSTYFGNNAIAGALNVVTKKPGDSFDAWGRLLYGQYEQYAAEGAVGGPIGDTFGVRLAVTRTGERGWIRNVNTEEYSPDVNNEAVRLTLESKPQADLDATLKVEGSENRIAGANTQWDNCPAPLPIGSTGAQARECPLALSLGVPIGFENNNNSGLTGQGIRLSTVEDVLTINYRRWSQTFTSVSGFYHYHYSQKDDEFNLPIYLETHSGLEKYHQFSQELRVASPTGGPIEYLAGVYFQTDQLSNDLDYNAPYVNFVASIPGYGALAPYLPFAWSPGFSQGEHVYSAFGSTSWNATDRLKLNAGLRGSWVYKNFTGVNKYGTSTQIYGGFTPIPPNIEPLWAIIEGPPGTVSASRSDHAWMPSGGVQYQINPDAMVYLTYTRGFKAGGFNGTLPFNLNAQNLEFGPEHVNAYEAGLKSKWFNDTVLLNLDVFRSNYGDLQANAQVFQPETHTSTQFIRNAAASISQGVELETQWAATRDIRFSVNITYLDAHFVSYPNASPTNLQTSCAAHYVLPYCSIYAEPVPGFANLAGQSTPYSPRWSGSIKSSYALTLPAEYRLTGELSPFFTSAYNQDPDFPVLGVHAYVRLDGRITLQNPNNRWALDLIGKNLTDRVIGNQIISSVATKEAPRNVAVQFRYRW